MRVDIVDVGRIDLGALQRRPHTTVGPIARLRRRRDVIGVARHAVADDFAVDLGPAGLRMFEAFQHDDAGALTHDEPIAIAIIRTRRLGRIVVEARRQRAARNEARHADAADRAFGAAGDHHLRIAQRHEPRGVTDGMGAGCARRDDRMVRPLEAMPDGHISAGKVDEPARNEERRDAPRTFFLQEDRRVGNTRQPSDTRADQDARRLLLLRRVRGETRILDRLLGGSHREK